MSRITSDAALPVEMSILTIEEQQPRFVHVQKGNLWGDLWSVELIIEPDLDADQLSFLARPPTRYEMTQKLAGEAAPNLLLSAPAQEPRRGPGQSRRLSIARSENQRTCE